jgi:hypothetical protein
VAAVTEPTATRAPNHQERHARAGSRGRRGAFAGADDAHLDRTSPADHLRHRRRTQPARQPPASRPAHHDLAGVALPRETQQLVGDARSRQHDRLAAELLRQTQRARRLGASRFSGLHVARQLDEDRDPRHVATLGSAPRRAQQRLRSGAAVDRHDRALRHGPDRLRGLGAPLRLHLLVDVLGGLA